MHFQILTVRNGRAPGRVLLTWAICIMLANEGTLALNKGKNRLAMEASPYLQMHSENPVDWYPWGEEALQTAREKNRLLIISIGYAACHWCHVMEDESFSRPETATLMNRDFISIKVDREERPDVDQVYMEACQLLTGQGGWPLNVVALPDGRPVYACTYLPQASWHSVLKQLSEAYSESPERFDVVAQKVTEAMKNSGALPAVGGKMVFDGKSAQGIFAAWLSGMDMLEGGQKGAPKFPMPAGLQYGLDYFRYYGDGDALKAVEATLEKMARGGIYDQLGGGFSRYSTDAKWRVPHFEKMLYDNAQLVSVYAAAFRLTGRELYRQVITETLGFIQREMSSSEHGFFSSLDADSEGEEGRFYSWREAEFDAVLGDASQVLKILYNVSPGGNWEGGRSVLFRTAQSESSAVRLAGGGEALRKVEKRARVKLLARRYKRPRPALDDKVVLAWNAMMITAYADAWQALGERKYLTAALENADFILARLARDDVRFHRVWKDGKAYGTAFLDDYAFLIRAWISLYQATFDEVWLQRAVMLVSHVQTHFNNPEGPLFFYTPDYHETLIARKSEILDNVIPSSNSVMAENLFVLGSYFAHAPHIERAGAMLGRLGTALDQGGSFTANWSRLHLRFAVPPWEVAIVGPRAEQFRKDLARRFLPEALTAGGGEKTGLPLLENKWKDGSTLVYICREKVCGPPMGSIEEVMAVLEEARRERMFD